MVALKRIVVGIFAVTVILLAIITGGIRLAIHNIDHFKPEIEYLLARYVSEGIVFSGISGDMKRFNPLLRIENVSINLPDRSQPLFVNRFEIEFDLFASLRERAPVVFEVTGNLEKIELIKDKSGRWWIHQFEIGGADSQIALPGFKRVLALLPRYLKLDLRRLIVRDQKTDKELQLDRISVQINNRNDQFFTRFSAALPDELGRGIVLKSVFDSDRSLIYLNSTNLKIPALARLFGFDPRALKDGALDGELWINMSGYKILSVKGDLVLKQAVLQVVAENTPLEVEYHARFNASNRNSSWRIANNIERLVIDGRSFSGIRSQLEISTRSENTIVSAWIDRLPISAFPALSGQWLPVEISKQIATGSFQGMLRDVMLRVDLQRPENFRISGRAVEVNSEAFADFPGATNLNADLVMGENKLRVRLYGENIRLDLGDHFKAPLELDALELVAVGERKENGNLLLALNRIQIRNRDIRASGRMWLEADAYERPFVFLRVNFADAIAGSTAKYIPLKFMPGEIQLWLEKGIKSGFVPRGDLQFHGRLADVREFDRYKSGEFFVGFDVEKADIFFAPGWLNARNGSGSVLFHNAAVEFELDRVSYEHIEDMQASGSIASFDEPVLTLKIKTEAPTADAVRVWIDTPVGKRFRDTVSNLHDFDGRVRVDVDIRLPLTESAAQQRVEVVVDFDDASAGARSWGLNLSRINGRLEVANDSIFARGLDAHFFGDPVEIDIESVKPGGDTVVQIRGRLASRNLLKRLPQWSTQYVKGNSDWQARLEIAGDSAPANQAFLKIKAASNLVGTEITLPHPLFKAGQEATRIGAELEFFPQQIRFTVDLGTQRHVRGELLANQDRDFKLASLDLALSTNLKPRQAKGINVYGIVEEISMDDWYAVFRDSDADNPNLFNFAELHADRVIAFKRTLENVEFDIKRSQQRYSGSLESSLVRGKFEIPLQTSSREPALIELDYLKLDKLDQDTGPGNLVPEDLMDFRLSSQALVFHDMLFNDLLVEARVVEDSLHVDNFSMRRDEIFLSGQAQWNYDAKEGSHISSMNTRIKGTNLGKAIAGIGFGDTMRDGKINFQGGFSWQASLLDLKPHNFVGDARLRIEDGVLNNVEPGSGRFVGLLSLSALPRRLSLDFSDVLIKGMEFDKITGSYRVDGGVLYTEDTRMEGIAAKIKISGQTGFVNRDYNQRIRVTPKIRQTLPLIGAVTAGSAVGWGLLLLQNLFKKSIDNAVEIEYQVTGSWDDPQIELVKAVDENQRELPEIDKK